MSRSAPQSLSALPAGVVPLPAADRLPGGHEDVSRPVLVSGTGAIMRSMNVPAPEATPQLLAASGMSVGDVPKGKASKGGRPGTTTGKGPGVMGRLAKAVGMGQGSPGKDTPSDAPAFPSGPLEISAVLPGSFKHEAHIGVHGEADVARLNLGQEQGHSLGKHIQALSGTAGKASAAKDVPPAPPVPSKSRASDAVGRVPGSQSQPHAPQQQASWPGLYGGRTTEARPSGTRGAVPQQPYPSFAPEPAITSPMRTSGVTTTAHGSGRQGMGGLGPGVSAPTTTQAQPQGPHPVVPAKQKGRKQAPVLPGPSSTTAVPPVSQHLHEDVRPSYAQAVSTGAVGGPRVQEAANTGPVQADTSGGWAGRNNMGSAVMLSADDAPASSLFPPLATAAIPAPHEPAMSQFHDARGPGTTVPEEAEAHEAQAPYAGQLERVEQEERPATAAGLSSAPRAPTPGPSPAPGGLLAAIRGFDRSHLATSEQARDREAEAVAHRPAPAPAAPVSMMGALQARMAARRVVMSGDAGRAGQGDEEDESDSDGSWSD